MKRSVALLILAIREKHKLPITTTNLICELYQAHEKGQKKKLKEIVQKSENVNKNYVLTAIDDLPSELDLSFLSSEHQQTNYFRANLNLIEPKGYKLCGESKSQLQYVPILESLKAFLQHPDVLAHLLNPVSCVHERDNGHGLHDFCDGSLYKQNPLLNSVEPTVQLILNCTMMTFK